MQNKSPCLAENSAISLQTWVFLYYPLRRRNGKAKFASTLARRVLMEHVYVFVRIKNGVACDRVALISSRMSDVTTACQLSGRFCMIATELTVRKVYHSAALKPFMEDENPLGVFPDTKKVYTFFVPSGGDALHMPTALPRPLCNILDLHERFLVPVRSPAILG